MRQVLLQHASKADNERAIIKKVKGKSGLAQAYVQLQRNKALSFQEILFLFCQHGIFVKVSGSAQVDEMIRPVLFWGKNGLPSALDSNA
jgi:hypothetical protein